MRYLAWDPHGSERRAANFAARLRALRAETYILRCQITNGRSTTPRPLLATRLDMADARAADIAARLLEAGI